MYYIINLLLWQVILLLVISCFETESDERISNLMEVRISLFNY